MREHSNTERQGVDMEVGEMHWELRLDSWRRWFIGKLPFDFSIRDFHEDDTSPRGHDLVCTLMSETGVESFFSFFVHVDAIHVFVSSLGHSKHVQLIVFRWWSWVIESTSAIWKKKIVKTGGNDSLFPRKCHLIAGKHQDVFDRSVDSELKEDDGTCGGVRRTRCVWRWWVFDKSHRITCIKELISASLLFTKEVISDHIFEHKEHSEGGREGWRNGARWQVRFVDLFDPRAMQRDALFNFEFPAKIFQLLLQH